MIFQKTVKVKGDDSNHHRPDISMTVSDDITREMWVVKVEVGTKPPFGFEQMLAYTLTMPEEERVKKEQAERARELEE